MRFTVTRRLLLCSAFTTLLLCASLAAGQRAGAAAYPPPMPPRGPGNPENPSISPTRPAGVIFSNVHKYAFGLNPNAVEIQVTLYDNFLGDFTKYWWTYTVTNHSYEPLPGTSNGFAGFELNLPVLVPDIGDIAAPDGIPPWLINCCSGFPVEWDLTDTGGAAVGGGTLPGQTERYSFTTLPRLITSSTGWFHTWENNIQTDLVYYPTGDGPEVPDLLAPPNEETCCTLTPAGAYVCQVLPAGQCAATGGTVVVDCNHCPPPTPALKKSWGQVKKIYR